MKYVLQVIIFRVENNDISTRSKNQSKIKFNFKSDVISNLKIQLFHFNHIILG